jgi:hypothetical protein
MKLTLAIGGVEVTVSGLDMDIAQVRSLMRHAASIALALPRDEPDPEITVEPERHPLGFTAHVELDPDRGGDFGPPLYDDEE